jgi:hypothetical protein
VTSGIIVSSEAQINRYFESVKIPKNSGFSTYNICKLEVNKCQNQKLARYQTLLGNVGTRSFPAVKLSDLLGNQGLQSLIT